MGEVFSFLQSRFPRCFKPHGEEKPLAHDIGYKLTELCEQERWPYSEEQVQATLKSYLNAPSYLHAMVTDTPRIGLDGKPNGCVAFKEQQSAEAKLALAELDLPGIASTTGFIC